MASRGFGRCAQRNSPRRPANGFLPATRIGSAFNMVSPSQGRFWRGLAARHGNLKCLVPSARLRLMASPRLRIACASSCRSPRYRRSVGCDATPLGGTALASTMTRPSAATGPVARQIVLELQSLIRPLVSPNYWAQVGPRCGFAHVVWLVPSGLKGLEQCVRHV